MIPRASPLRKKVIDDIRALDDMRAAWMRSRE
jgi:hypothetical protein